MIQNLLAIKEFEREKLIRNAKLQIEDIENLTLKKLFPQELVMLKKRNLQEIIRKLTGIR